MSEEISNNEKNTLGLVALILAIIGLLLTISVFGSILGIPLLCLALLLGIIALFKRPRGNAVASVILSVLPLGALAYLFGSLFSLLAVPATDFVHWITEESEQNPAIQAAFEQEGFNSFLQSRLEVSMKNADRASLFKNGVSWKSKVSGASTLMFNLIKAEIPGAVEDWVAQYGLPEGMQNFEGPETVWPLSNTNWALQEFDGQEVIGNYHLDFTTSKVATSFCNTLGGEYFTVDNQIFGEFIQTNMACFDEEKTSLESAFDLNGATFDRVDAQLIITTPAGHIFIYALLSSPTSSGTNQLLTTGEVTTLTKEDIDATDAQDPEQLREVLKENFNPKPYF